MPGRKHLHGVGNEEQRMYEHIRESSAKSGRYGKRAKEVAAQTVMEEVRTPMTAEGVLFRQPFLNDVEQMRSHTCNYLREASAEGRQWNIETVIRLFSQIQCIETAFALRDIYKSQLAARDDAPEVADELLVQALEGWNHAALAAAQIAKLGGDSTLQTNRLPPRYRLRQVEGMSPEDMIRENLAGGQIVMEICRESIRSLEDRDSTSRAVIERILALEERQTRRLKMFLENTVCAGKTFPCGPYTNSPWPSRTAR
jgi:bacterioferritin (cytochrome b1)